VFAGQCRLIELGFRQGGPAGFGLRRVLLVECGPRFKLALTTGEKSFGYSCPACGDCPFQIVKY